MSPTVSLDHLLGRTAKEVLKTLTRSVVTHDSLDDMALGNLLEDSPRFRTATVENPPVVPPAIEEPDPIDFTTATPKEIADWQEKARTAKKAKEDAPAYGGWDALTGDMFRTYHTHDTPEIVDEVDPGVELHKRIMPKLLAQDEHAESRNMTRDDPTLAAIATMAAVKHLRTALDEELSTQVREQQEFEEARQQAREQQGSLESMREEARAHHDAGQAIPEALKESIKQSVQEQRSALERCQAIQAAPTPMSMGAQEAIAGAAEAGASAAQAAQGMPSFGAGSGAGEPTYTSPEQALSIAEQWANNPDLKHMAELFGRMDRDLRFKRSKRVVGGEDEIVDVTFGDNLRRVVPSELALLSDADLEDDFLARYAGGELLQFSTVGEENAGRGPILMVLDGSGSMQGERNVWSRATAMCLLHIARIEKRDFGLIEFSSGGQLAEWVFPAKRAMAGEEVVDMASHFFGGGTTPVIGVARAAEIMKSAPAFRKADVVLIGDGEAGFGPEDERLKRELLELGVRLFGIGIGGSFTYLESYCDFVVDVRDFELTDPSAATAELATHIT